MVNSITIHVACKYYRAKCIQITDSRYSYDRHVRGNRFLRQRHANNEHACQEIGEPEQPFG